MAGEHVKRVYVHERTRGETGGCHLRLFTWWMTGRNCNSYTAEESKDRVSKHKGNVLGLANAVNNNTVILIRSELRS